MAKNKLLTSVVELYTEITDLKGEYDSILESLLNNPNIGQLKYTEIESAINDAKGSYLTLKSRLDDMSTDINTLHDRDDASFEEIYKVFNKLHDVNIEIENLRSEIDKKTFEIKVSIDENTHNIQIQNDKSLNEKIILSEAKSNKSIISNTNISYFDVYKREVSKVNNIDLTKHIVSKSNNVSVNSNGSLNVNSGGSEQFFSNRKIIKQGNYVENNTTYYYVLYENIMLLSSVMSSSAMTSLFSESGYGVDFGNGNLDIDIIFKNTTYVDSIDFISDTLSILLGRMSYGIRCYDKSNSINFDKVVSNYVADNLPICNIKKNVSKINISMTRRYLYNDIVDTACYRLKMMCGVIGNNQIIETCVTVDKKDTLLLDKLTISHSNSFFGDYNIKHSLKVNDIYYAFNPKSQYICGADFSNNTLNKYNVDYLTDNISHTQRYLSREFLNFSYNLPSVGGGGCYVDGGNPTYNRISVSGINFQGGITISFEDGTAYTFKSNSTPSNIYNCYNGMFMIRCINSGSSTISILVEPISLSSNIKEIIINSSDIYQHYGGYGYSGARRYMYATDDGTCVHRWDKGNHTNQDSKGIVFSAYSLDKSYNNICTINLTDKSYNDGGNYGYSRASYVVKATCKNNVPVLICMSRRDVISDDFNRHNILFKAYRDAYERNLNSYKAATTTSDSRSLGPYYGYITTKNRNIVGIRNVDVTSSDVKFLLSKDNVTWYSFTSNWVSCPVSDIKNNGLSAHNLSNIKQYDWEFFGDLDKVYIAVYTGENKFNSMTIDYNNSLFLPIKNTDVSDRGLPIKFLNELTNEELFDFLNRISKEENIDLYNIYSFESKSGESYNVSKMSIDFIREYIFSKLNAVDLNDIEVKVSSNIIYINNKSNKNVELKIVYNDIGKLEIYNKEHLDIIDIANNIDKFLNYDKLVEELANNLSISLNEKLMIRKTFDNYYASNLYSSLLLDKATDDIKQEEYDLIVANKMLISNTNGDLLPITESIGNENIICIKSPDTDFTTVDFDVRKFNNRNVEVIFYCNNTDNISKVSYIINNSEKEIGYNVTKDSVKIRMLISDKIANIKFKVYYTALATDKYYKSEITPMSSNTMNGQSVSASSYHPTNSYPPYLSVDGNKGGAHGWLSTTTANPIQWWKIEFDSYKKIEKYTIYKGYRPSQMHTWNFIGVNDDLSEDTLHSISNCVWGDGDNNEEKTFVFNCDKMYKSYKINTFGNYGQNYITIGREIEMYSINKNNALKLYGVKIECVDNYTEVIGSDYTLLIPEYGANVFEIPSRFQQITNQLKVEVNHVRQVYGTDYTFENQNGIYYIKWISKDFELEPSDDFIIKI